MRVEAYVIHLERSKQRRPQVETLLATLPLPASVLHAVDGLSLPEAELRARYRRDIHRPRYPFELRPQEIACFLSHRKAWAAIVEGGLDAGLVVEDDVATGEGFAYLLDLATAALQPLDLIRFPRWTRGEAGPVIASGGAASIVQPRLPGLGMQMQLVGREAAQALLHFTQAFDRPVDTTVQMRWLHPVRILSARPVSIREIDATLGGTSIQNKSRPLGDRLAREIKRPLYRAAVRISNAARGRGGA